jgi:hypothetical protein
MEVYLQGGKLKDVLVACLRRGLNPHSRNKAGISVTTYARQFGLLSAWEAALQAADLDSRKIIEGATDLKTKFPKDCPGSTKGLQHTASKQSAKPERLIPGQWPLET